MKQGRRTALLILPAAFFCLAALAAARSVGAQELPGVDSCINRLDPRVDIGFERIAARCPELARQLEHGGWSAWLPRGWQEPRNDLSAGSLRQLRELAGRESAANISTRTPDTRRLRGVLSELGNTGASDRSAWARFKTWLRSMLESRAEPAGESWLTRTIARVGFSQSMPELISYFALAAVVVLAGLIVVNELRTAGLRARTARRQPAAPTQVRPAERNWHDVERASPSDRPRLLLQLIVTRLSAGGYLPPSGGLTVRELTRAVRLRDDGDRTRLADIALAAERVRFSGLDIAADGLEAPLARGRELLERLDAGTAS